MTDYAVEGNALAEISRADGGRRVRMLRRLQSYDATTVMSGSTVYYESQIADGDGARVVVDSDLVGALPLAAHGEALAVQRDQQIGVRRVPRVAASPRAADRACR